MPEYDFRTLSPSDFELLVRDLLAAEHRWQLEAFGRGRDGGVDLRCWTDDKKIVVQCKHYAGSTFADLRSAARQELAKMDDERPDRYLFVTSQDLSRTQKDTLASELSRWLANSSDLLTMRDLNALLGKHGRVERQHFKLWLASTEVLQRIVHNGLWARSEALMEDIKDRVKLYVRSPGFDRAAERLDANHVVVLTGAPGVGKSMLAEMILLTHWHDGWSVVAISSDIDEAWTAYRRDEKQIFVYDDFLGQTDVSERSAKNEDASIVRFMDRVSKDPSKRLVMTTRSQILQQAALVREPIARGNFQLRECVIEISDYGMVERARILYNHLYFSSLPRQVLRDYVAGEHYWAVVDHPNFSPRIIEQVIKRDFETAAALAAAIIDTLDRPIELWGIMFATVLSDVARRIVLTLATFPPDGLSVDTLRHVARRDANPIEFTHALRALEGTYIFIAKKSENSRYPSVFYDNPSVRDFVLATLDSEPLYFLQLVTEAVQTQQILTLLQYAHSSTGNELKFPGLAAAVSENEEIVASQIRKLVSGALEVLPTKHSRWQIQPTVLQPLARIVSYSSVLMPTQWSSLLDYALDINEQYAEYGNSSTIELLTNAVINRAGKRLDNAHELIEDLVSHWGRSIEGTDELRSFIAFVEKHEKMLSPYFDLRRLLKMCAERSLRLEIEAIADNRHDEATDSQWLDEVERLVVDLGIKGQLGRAIDSERESIADYYSEAPVRSSDTARRAAPSVPRQEATGDRSYVEDIFRQLS